MTKAEKIFNERIMGMMVDNQCTMKEALEWDFEAFEFNIQNMDRDLLKDEFMFYMFKNGISVDSELVPFYTSVILGEQDYGLRKDKVKTGKK